MTEWHRLLGLIVTDYFTDTCYEVILEKDLSTKQQFLDVLVIEKKDGTPPENPQDGLENMSVHNMMTYKSHQQTLDDWSIFELTGHYVN